MKLYYYAFTGHKYGLDRLKRAVVILNKLREQGIETMLLVNDFRAGLVAKDLGVPESVHIEGIQDIDAIAEIGDCVIIDSPEDDHGRLVKYCSDFKRVFRVAETDEEKSIHGELMLSIDCEDEDCISSVVVDDLYFEEHEKEERTLFFLGDSDANKTILNNAEFFKAFDMELLLGHYFYVKYEDDLEKIFKTLHEAEEYTELICSSTRVVTASFQTALEAKVVGAEVVFIELKALRGREKQLLDDLGIIIINELNIDTFKELEFKNILNSSKIIEKSAIIVSKIIKNLE